MFNGVCILLCLSLVGCGSYAPKEVVKKGSRYVRDRENDYHTSYFVPPLKVPENLSALDATREQICPDGILEGKPNVNIEPPGLL